MSSLWDRYQQFLVRDEGRGFWGEVCGMGCSNDFLAQMKPAARRAYSATTLNRADGASNGNAQTAVPLGVVLGDDHEAACRALNHPMVNDSAVKLWRGATAADDTFAFAG